MIKLKSRSPFSPEPPILSKSGCTAAIEDILKNYETHKVTQYYNDETVRTGLIEAHGVKCVYCESNIQPASWYRVDHYRPKKFIKGVPKEKHPGYYWLAYEWSNFLLSCEVCNGSKSNEFPLHSDCIRLHPKDNADITKKENRAIDQKPLTNERRLLLHPELDEVEKYLVFRKDGRVYSSDEKTAQHDNIGLTSIRVYSLNRDSLVLERKKKIDAYWHQLIDILNDYEDNGANEFAVLHLKLDLKRYFKNMLAEQGEKKPYSRTGFYMFHSFKEFYLSRLTDYGDAKIVEDYYNSLISHK